MNEGFLSFSPAHVKRNPLAAQRHHVSALGNSQDITLNLQDCTHSGLASASLDSCFNLKQIIPLKQALYYRTWSNFDCRTGKHAGSRECVHS